MRVFIVEQLTDNYAYVIAHEGATEAAVVDPSEPEKIQEVLDREGLKLRAILNTHHHWDHTGGNESLLKQDPSLEVFGYAPDAERIPGITQRLEDGDDFSVVGLAGQVLAVPCHTSGHIAYRFPEVVFSGDTLFAAGCGRFFEGTAQDMYRSLIEVLGGLPAETLVYCGHEYTESNLRFALHVEPDNTAVTDKLEAVRRTRARNEPTIPTTLQEERSYNPFLRPTSPTICATVKKNYPDTDIADPVAVLGALRTMKDAF